MQDTETEAKFYLNDLPALEKKLIALGAERIQPRVHEINLRFDTPGNKLTQAHQVLRLRKDKKSHLTFKGPARLDDRAVVRQEIEFEVSNFEAAKRFLEALNYRVSVSYEKYRTTYQLDIVEVVLDEMPYGNFVEIEGPDSAAIQVAAVLLKLDWSACSTESYLALFNNLRARRKTKAHNLVFSEFEGQTFSAADLGLRPADGL